jgi:hypothetical protein
VLLGCGVIGIAIGFGALLLIRGSDSASNATNPMPACATQDAVFLPAESYGNFIQAVDGPITPFSEGKDPSENPDTPTVRGKGYFDKIALDPRYKEENGAQARALGYEVGNRPFLPLSGSIVKEHGGVLEAYQVNFSFPSVEGAVQRMANARIQNADILVDTALLGNETYAWESPPADPGHEKAVAMGARLGNALVSFRFQGGAGLRATDLVSYIEDALSRLRATCGGE